MRRIASIITLGLAFLMSVATIAFLVDVGGANPFFPSGSIADEPIPPAIDIQSPLQSQKYDLESEVWLNFKVTVPKTTWHSGSNRIGTTFGKITSVRYSLDGEQEQSIALNEAEQSYGEMPISCNLGYLSLGRHTTKVTAEGLAYYGSITHDLYAGSTPSFKESVPTKLLSNSVEVTFIVGRIFPSVQILSPMTITYATSEVLLNFIIESIEVTKIAYSLDGKEDVAISGNRTLMGLSDGVHSVTIYVWDETGNMWASETIFFTITEEPETQPESEPFPKWIAVAIATVALVGAAFLIYFTKIKKQLRKPKNNKFPT